MMERLTSDLTMTSSSDSSSQPTLTDSRIRPALSSAFGGTGTNARERLNALMAQRRLTRHTGKYTKYSMPQRVLDNIEEFCATTSAHGLPRVAAAHATCQRFLWSMIFALCLAAFIGQAYMIVDKFNRNEKIVNVELKFETMPFPAVTVCNLNPYQRSKAEQTKGVADMLSAFANVITSNEEQQLEQSVAETQRRRRSAQQQQRSSSSRLIEAVLRPCDCSTLDEHTYFQCTPTQQQTLLTSTCVCAMNTQTDMLWPCYRTSVWHVQHCVDCNAELGTCTAVAGLETQAYGCWCEYVTNVCIYDPGLNDSLIQQPNIIVEHSPSSSTNDIHPPPVGAAKMRQSSENFVTFSSTTPTTTTTKLSESMSSDVATRRQPRPHVNRFQLVNSRASIAGRRRPVSRELIDLIQDIDTTIETSTAAAAATQITSSQETLSAPARHYGPLRIDLDKLPTGRRPVIAVRSACSCEHTQGCRATTLLQPAASEWECVCAFDTANIGFYNCWPLSDWHMSTCTQCGMQGYCSYSSPSHNVNSNAAVWSTTCACDRRNHRCIAIDHTENNRDNNISVTTNIPQIWNYTTTTLLADSSNNRTKRQLSHDYNAFGSGSAVFERHIKRLAAAAALDPLLNRPATRFHQLARVSCDCSRRSSTCTSFIRRVPQPEDTMCFCPLDVHGDLHAERNRGTILWPCYEESQWTMKLCQRCDNMGTCSLGREGENGTLPCGCTDIIGLCIRVKLKTTDDDDVVGKQPTDDRSVVDEPVKTEKELFHELDEADALWEQVMNESLINVWEATTLVPTESPVEVERKEQALGFQGMKDGVAIKAKARENLVFATAEMDESEKKSISTSKTEFIKQCSFNGRDCSVENDFKTNFDPNFGNCFTFDTDNMTNVTNDRAGPDFGLRLEIFVNTSEYLPTTEASGVRLTVHPGREQPFPDTVGFSAPVGSVSSFGIHLLQRLHVRTLFRGFQKKVNRLPQPWGDCVADGKNDQFIYRDKEYTVEACHRSCMQNHLVKECGCGDPRFPAVFNKTNCPATNPDHRDCLERERQRAARMAQQGRMQDCHCPQPCEQFIYSVSYSAATWPASHVQVDCRGMPPDDCLKHYRNEMVMVEIFYEALNYEALKETDAYGWPNLLSDFGGQLGLWMGVSVITCMEFLILVWSLFTIVFCCGRTQTYSLARQNGSVVTGDDAQIAMPLYKPVDEDKLATIIYQPRATRAKGDDNSFFLV